MSIVNVGLFLRLGVAVRGEGDATTGWFRDVLGGRVADSFREPGDTHSTTMLGLGGTQLAVFSASPDDTSGVIGRFVDRYGAGLHSLAWTVDDLDVAEESVREHGFTVTGINRDARHWFLHPKETHGILIEITDQGSGRERTVADTSPARDIAWMTAVVEDIAGSQALLERLLGANVVLGLPAGPPDLESTVDLRIGDIVLRLVEPESPESRYSTLDGKGLVSMTLLVDSLDAVPLPLVGIEGERAWSDPTDSLGMTLEWTTVSPGWPT